MSNEYDFSVDYGLGGSGEGLSYEPSSADTYDYSFDDPYKKVDYSLGSSKDSGEGLNTDDFSYSVGDGFRYTGGSQEGLRVQDFDYSPSQGITYNKGTSNADLSSSGLINTIAKLVGNLKKDDIAKMLAAGWTIKDILAGRKARKAASVPAGKWTADPNLTATRTQLAQAPSAPGQGAMGQQRFTPTTYGPRTAAQGGIMGLAAGGLRDGAFVIPADVVSHFGNGSSEAGLEFLAKKLGATPIKGKGDGMSDSIDTTIEGRQPAKVANEEALVSPEKVAALGKGDPKKGAKVLYAMMDRVRKARTGTKKQGKQIKPEKYAPGGIAGYAGGGAIAFVEGGATAAPINTNIAAWATPYVQDFITKGFATANMPYQAYTGALSAGQSELQKQAFDGYKNWSAPSGFGTASTMLTDTANKMGELGYSPTSFTNPYTAPADYQATQFTNQYTAPDAYKAGVFNTGLGEVKSVEDYMNPYLQNVSNIEAREARREAGITGMGQQAKLAQAGAFGGSRDAIMRAELARNLGTQIGDIKSKGLQNAYDRAMKQRLDESAASVEAQRLGELSRQYGYTQGMSANELQAKYGVTAQEASELSKQYGYTKQSDAAARQAEYDLAAQKASEESKQFGAGYGLDTLKAKSNAAQALGSLAGEEARYGLAGLEAQLRAGGTQRGIEADKIAADLAQFNEQRGYDLKMQQYKQGLLGGLPVEQGPSAPAPTLSTEMIQGLAGLAKTYPELKTYFEGMYGNIFGTTTP